MSSLDDTKEIPARQDPGTQQPEPWRVHTDGSGEHCVIASDGQIVAITIPLDGEGNSNDDTRARALCLAKAPEMHRFLSHMIDYVDGRICLSDADIHVLFENVRNLIKRAE